MFHDALPDRWRQFLGTDLIWHLLFLDAGFLFLRFGGMAVVDLLVHGAFVLVALIWLILFGKPRVARPIWPFVVGFGLLIVAALIQLIPLPESLFPLLAPVKARIAASVAALYPIAHPSHQITFVPQLHVLKLAVLALDAGLVFLVLMLPRPRSTVFQFWLYGLSFPIGALAVMQGRGLLNESHLLHVFAETHGPLVNVNHFGVLTAVLMVFLLQNVVKHGYRLTKYMRHGSSNRRREFSNSFLHVTASLICAALLFLGFQYGYSRSGVLILLLILLVFSGLALRTFFKEKLLGHRARFWMWIPLGVLIVFFFLPMGRNLEKMQRLGLDPQNRLNLLSTAFDYLADFPVLGTGQGSAEEILDPATEKAGSFPDIVRELHNDYVQIVLEFGILGLIGLGLLCVGMVRGLTGSKGVRKPEEALFSNAVWAMVIGLGVHSLVSFPLRVTAIRVLFLVLIGLALKLGPNQQRAKLKTGPVLGIAMIFIAFAVGYFIWALPKTSPVDGASPQTKFALKYGRFYRQDLFEAKERMAVLMDDPPSTEEAFLEKTQQIEHSLARYLTHQPFGLKALNLLFVLEVWKGQLDMPRFDRATFEALKEKANQIRALGKDRNMECRLPLLFLLAQFQDHLNDEERVMLAELKEPISSTYKRKEREWRDR